MPKADGNSSSLALKLQVLAIPQPSRLHRSSCGPVRAEPRASAALQDSGDRPAGCRSPAEPERPWEPGSAPVSGGCGARGRALASPACRPHRVPGPLQPEDWRERRGQRLGGPGRRGSSRQHRGCSGQLAGNFPPTTGLARAFRRRHSLNRAAASSFLARFSGVVWRWGRSREAQAGLRGPGVAAVPGRN